MQDQMTITPSLREVENMDKQIRYLKAQANTSEEQAKESFQTQIKALEDRFRVLQARVEKASAASEAASDEISTGLNRAWKEFTESVEKAKKFLH